MRSVFLLLTLACSLDATTYYVRKTGSDSNAGTSAGAAWVTITKPFAATCGGGSSPCTTGGDTIYVGAGVYRETVSVANTYSSVVTLIADWDGVQTGDSGTVVLTSSTTNDLTLGGNSSTFDFNGKSNITVQGLQIVSVGSSSNNAAFGITTATSTGITIKNCVIKSDAVGSVYGIVGTVAADSNANWAFDSNIFYGFQHSINLSLTRSASADFDTNITVKNNLFASGADAVHIVSTGASTFFGGGVRVYNNTCFSTGYVTEVANTQISSTYPTVSYGNIANVRNNNGAVFCQAIGQCIEDYNLLTGRGNTPVGANSMNSNNGVAPSVQVAGGLLSGSLVYTFFPTKDAAWKNMGTITGDTRPPATTVDDSSTGTITWTNPNSSQQSDAVYATNVVTASAVSHWLKATNFGFAVPGGATIIGILVDVQRYKSAGTGVLADNSIKLVNSSGTITGTDHAVTGAWPGSTTFTSYGNVAGGDLWGLALAPADVNNSAFGVAFSVKETGGAASATASVDIVRMTVFYTPQITVDLQGTSRPYGTVLFGAEGTATSGGNQTLTDTGATWPVNGYKGYVVNLTGGTGSGQVKDIQSNTGTVLTVDGFWKTNPDNTSTYKIYQGVMATTGKLTTGGTTLQQDSHAAWGTNQWTGFVFKVDGGTGATEYGSVCSNTATGITLCTAPGITTDSTSTYSMYKAPGTSTTSINYSPGAVEVPQTCFKSTVSLHTNGNSARIMGPGYCDFQIAVSPISTTVSVWALADSLYAGTKAQFQVLNATEAGYAGSTVTSTAAASSWQKLSITFTPTSAGIVTLRIISNSTAATGSAYFGDFGKIDRDSTKFGFLRRQEFFLSPHSLTPVVGN